MRFNFPYSSLVSNISKLEQIIADLELRLHREKDLHMENNELKIKTQLLDKELLEAVRISKFLQEKNQILETKVNHLLQLVQLFVFSGTQKSNL